MIGKYEKRFKDNIAIIDMLKSIRTLHIVSLPEFIDIYRDIWNRRKNEALSKKSIGRYGVTK